jgi:hypothetical protein
LFREAAAPDDAFPHAVQRIVRHFGQTTSTASVNGMLCTSSPLSS